MGGTNSCIWPPHCLISGRLSDWTLMPEFRMRPAAGVGVRLQQGREDHEKEAICTSNTTPLSRPNVSRSRRPIHSTERSLCQFADGGQDILAVCGWARASHCLANTMRDVVSTFKDDSYVGKIVLLTDGTSPVHLASEKFGTDFIKRNDH